MSERRATILVRPRGERRRRARLLAALEELLPVRFVEDGGGAVACVGFGAGAELPDGLPALRLHGAEPAAARAPQRVALARAGVDPRLAGEALAETRSAGSALAADGAEALARCGRAALWVRRGERQEAALAPAELAGGEPLRDRLQPDRWLALAPLVQFLREACGASGWRPPPPRATFLFDDPNLHWPSYGFLRFAELAAAASAHRYHVCCATIPLDAWFAHRSAVATFLRNPDQLSLLIHGNDHLGRELARPLAAAERRALLAQALRRARSLEARTGISVSAVMAAPHGVCSEEMAATMLECGFEALTISRPYPWLARPPEHWLASPAGAGPLVGARPAELVAGGLPVLLRTTLDHDLDDYLLRAFLDQPLIVAGHHDDLSAGPDRLAEVAAAINRIPGVRWQSPAAIARASYLLRRREGVAWVRPYGRVLEVETPPGAAAIAIEPPAAATGPSEADEEDVLTVGGAPARFGEPVPLEPGGGPVAVRIRSQALIDPARVPPPRRRPWPALRRLAAEGRDRLQASPLRISGS